MSSRQPYMRSARLRCPNILWKRPAEPEDMERFQCIFARNEGAVTAPSSGLHFSRELMKRLEIKGVDFALRHDALRVG